MKSSNFSAIITMRKVKRAFSYDNKTMLTLSITFPEVILRHNTPAQNNINRHIQTQVNDFYRYASTDLYQQAIAYYKETQKNGFPFFHYDAVLQYTITYNRQCHLSMYRDQYEFTGGAHGNTIRASDTWNLTNGLTLQLSAFFSPSQDFHAFLIKQILGQADQQMQQNPGIYFEDYQALIVQYFNEKSYYLTSSGVAIYYQQYEIAPYSTGIVVFIIPYETLQWNPSCSAYSSPNVG